MSTYTVNIGPCDCCGGGYCNFTWTSTYSCSTLEWSQPTPSVVFSQTKATESTAWNISCFTATWNSEGVSGSSQSDCDTKTPPSPPQRLTVYPPELGGVTPQPPDCVCQAWARTQFRISRQNAQSDFEQVWLTPSGGIAVTQRQAEWNPTAVSDANGIINYPPTTSTQSFYITYDPAARTLVFKLQNAIISGNQTSPESRLIVPANKLTSQTLIYPIHMFVGATGTTTSTPPTTASGTRFYNCVLNVTGEPAVQLPNLTAVWPGPTQTQNRYLTGARLGKGFTITGNLEMSWTGQRPVGSGLQAWFGFVDTTSTPTPVGIL